MTGTVTATMLMWILCNYLAGLRMLFLFVNHVIARYYSSISFIKLCSPKLILEMQVHDSATFFVLVHTALTERGQGPHLKQGSPFGLFPWPPFSFLLLPPHFSKLQAIKAGQGTLLMDIIWWM